MEQRLEVQPKLGQLRNGEDPGEVWLHCFLHLSFLPHYWENSKSCQREEEKVSRSRTAPSHSRHTTCQMSELDRRPEFANWTHHLIKLYEHCGLCHWGTRKKGSIYRGNQRQWFENYDRHENMSCHYLVVLRLSKQMVLTYNYIF